MKKLLNTLYVTTPEAYLSKDGTNVVVSVKQNEVFRIPALNIQAIVTFGYQGASPGLMRLCAENGISLSFFSPTGKFVARIQGPVSGNVLLRKQQYDLSSDGMAALGIAKAMIGGKIFNSRVALRRFVRDYPQSEDIETVDKASDKLQYLLTKSGQVASTDELRGIEGEVAAIYFSVLPKLVIHQKEEFRFEGRNKRPPLDPFNAMLSFGYTLLTSEVASALEGVGLDPAVGFLHTIRPGRASLALDMIEEFRSYLVDRLVLSLINRKQITRSDFLIHDSCTENDENVPVIMTDAGRKIFLDAWQSRKKEVITHPFLEEKIPLGLLPHAQAMLLARFLRGDLDAYPVFLVR